MTISVQVKNRSRSSSAISMSVCLPGADIKCALPDLGRADRTVEISVTMDEIPFALDAAIVSESRGWSLRCGIGIDGYLATFEADRLSEVTAFKRDDVLRD